jgi:hypothetical protein
VFTDVDKPLARSANDRRASWITGVIKSHRSRHHSDEHGARVTVPSAFSAGLKSNHLGGDVKAGLGFYFYMQRVSFSVDVECVKRPPAEQS